MGTIVYQEKNGSKYAYMSESYWDKDKKAPRSKRTYLGRVDPETGEIIKAKPKGKKEASAPDASLIREKEEEILRLRKELEEMTARYTDARNALGRIAGLAGPYSD